MSAKKPKTTERQFQSIFNSLECRRDHLRIMLPESARKAALTCKICTDDHSLRLQHRSCPSKHERLAYSHLDSHKFFEGGPQRWATEVAVFQKFDSERMCLKASRADLVFFSGDDVSPCALQRGLLVYIDGEGHFPWTYSRECAGKEKAALQRVIDNEVSSASAQHGFRLIRICWKDMHDFLSIVKAAWQLPQGNGFSYVSQQWNSGARLEVGFPFRSPRDQLEVDWPQVGIDSCNVFHLFGLA